MVRLFERAKFTVILYFCILTSLYCVFDFFKITNMNIFAINSNPYFISMAISLYNKTNSLDSAFAINWYSFILIILIMSGFAQIIPLIVRRVNVFMVYLFFWPFSSYIKPSKSMCPIMKSIYFNSYVTSMRLFAACRIASIFSVRASSQRWSVFPCKNTSLGIIIKNIANIFSRKKLFFFAASYKVLGSHVRNSLTLLVRDYQAVITLVNPAYSSQLSCRRQELTA